MTPDAVLLWHNLAIVLSLILASDSSRGAHAKSTSDLVATS